MKKITSMLIALLVLCGMLAMTVSATEAPLVYEYSSGGDTPNTSTVTIDPTTGKVSVEFLAATMYQGSYETTYTYENGTLAIETVESVDATDISGFAAIIGLPATLTSNVFHVAEAAEGGVTLKIWFDGGDGDDTLLFDGVIYQADLDKLAPAEEPEDEPAEDPTYEPEGEPENPKTGDNVYVAVLTCLVTISVVTVTGIFGKKRYSV